MLLEGRHPGRGIRRIALQNLVIAHDTVFQFVNAHQPIANLPLSAIAKCP
jgi:hypothetical protein